MLESLEQRVLLSADPSFLTAGALSADNGTTASMVENFDGADLGQGSSPGSSNAFAGLSSAELGGDEVTGLGLQILGEAEVQSSEGVIDELPAGTLILGSGANGGSRSDASTSGDDEHFRVEKVAGKYLVSYLQDGQVLGAEEFTGVSGIYFDGGEGDDILEIGAGVDVAVIAHGGAGNDSLKLVETDKTVSLSDNQAQAAGEAAVGYDGFESLELSAEGGSVTVTEQVELAGELKISTDDLDLQAGLAAASIELTVVEGLSISQPTGELLVLEAETLKIDSGAGAGAADAPVYTQVDNLSVVANGGVYLAELDGATVDGIESNGGDVSILNLAGELTVAGEGIDARGGDVTLTTQAIDIQSPVRSEAGALLTVQPLTADQTIGIGAGAGGAFNLTPAELDLINTGFGTDGTYDGITIGRADGRHQIEVGAYTFRDSITLRSPVAPGSIHVTGVLGLAEGALQRFIGAHSTSVLLADTYSDGTNILYEDSVRVGAGLSVLITSGPLGGHIIIQGGIINDIFVPGNLDGATLADALTENLTIDAGEGNVVIQGAVGSDVPLNNLTIVSAGSVTIAGSINITGTLRIIKATGLVHLNSSSGNLTAGAIDITSAANIIFEGSVTTTTAGPSLKVSTNTTDGTVTFKGAVNAAGNLTVSAAHTVLHTGVATVTGSISQVLGTGTTTYQAAVTANSINLSTVNVFFNASVSVANGSDIILTADEITFTGGAGSVTSAGIDTSTIYLRPTTSVVPIKLGISAGSNPGVLDLSNDDLAALNSRFKEVRIGWDGAATTPVALQAAALTAFTSGGADLAAALAQVVSPGSANDLIFTARTSGAIGNGILVRIEDDGSVTGNAATARYFEGTKILLIKVDLGATTALTVLTEVNNNTINNTTSLAYGAGLNPVIASAGTDYTGGAGTFATVISAKLAGGTDAAAATTILPISGSAVNDLSFLADSTGAAGNGITIALLHGNVNNVDAQYNAGTKVLTVTARLSPVFGEVAHTSLEIATAINAVVTFPLTASVVGAESQTSGDIEIGQSTISNPSLFYARSMTHLGDLTVTDKVTFKALYGGIDAPGIAQVNTTDLVVTATGEVRLNTNVSTLSASNAADGSIVITEASAITVNQLDTINGHASLFTTTGSITIASAGTGVVTSGGNVILRAADSIQQDDVVIADGGDITLQAVTGSVTMAAAASSTNDEGAIRYVAVTGLTLSVIDAGSGDVSLIASGGSISDQNGTTNNITASALRIETSGNVGSTTDALEITVTTVAGQAGGSFFLTEATGITVGSVSVTSHYWNSNLSQTDVTDVALNGLKTTANGAIVLDAVDGGVTVSQVVDANGTGNIRLTALGAGRDLTLNAAVTSGSGHITLLAGQSITQSAAGDVTTTGGTIDAEASTGSIGMVDGALSQSGGGNIRYKAATNVAVGGLNAGSGSISITATSGSITDAGDTHREAVGTALRLVAGTGVATGANALEITTGTLTASAGAGGIYLLEEDSVTVDTVGPISVNRVATDGTVSVPTQQTDAALSDLAATGVGNIVLRTTNGSITINEGTAPAGGVGVSTASGNILLQTLPFTGNDDDLILNAAVTSTSGNISLIANNSVTQAAAGDVQTGSTATIDVQAQNGSITMTDGATAVTGGGSLRYRAAVDVLVGGLSAVGGSVSILTTTGSILDNGDADKDVIATSLRLSAGSGAGNGANLLDVAVTTIAATAAGGGIFVADDDAVTVGTVAAITVNRVDLDGTTPGASQQTDSSLGGLTTTAGNGRVVLVTLNGSLLVSQAVTAHGSGNILLQANTSQIPVVVNDKDITLDAAVTSGTGRISVLANRHVIQNASGDITTTTANGTIDVEATTGSVTMADGALSSTTGGNIRYKAASSVSAGGMSAGAGNVSIVATAGSITDAGDAHKDVSGASLRLQAGNGIGATGNHLDTAVTVVAAQAGGGGIYLTDDDAVTVGLVSIIAVGRVQTTGSTLNQQDSALSGETTLSGNGNIVQTTLSGTLTVSQSVVAHGSGNILLAAGGTNADAVINNPVVSTSGNITITATRDITQGSTGDISTSSGTIDVEAFNGSVTMADGAKATTTGGGIRYQAKLDVAVGGLDAAAGKVAIKADRDIVDNGDSDKDVVASELWMLAGNGIGSNTGLLDITVTTLAAQAGAGGILVTEDTDLVVGSVTSLQVQRVGVDGDVDPYPTAPDTNLSGLLTNLSGGHIVVFTLNGKLTLNQIVSAAGTGNILLQARTTGANDKDVQVSAGVSSATGSITVLANRHVIQDPVGDLLTGGTGTIDVEAQNGTITMSDSGTDSALATTGGGNIRYKASINVLLGGLNAATGDISVVATTGSISDNGNTAIEVTGDEVRFVALVSVGSNTNHLETSVNELAARASSNGVYVTNAIAMAVDSVSQVAANRVQTTGGTLTEQDSAALSGATTIVANGSIAISTSAGTLTVNQVVTAFGTGNILLSTLGTGGDLTLNAVVSSTSGSISVLSFAGISQTAAGDITTGAATVDVEAMGGSITMANGALTQTAAGNIRYKASGSVAVGGLNATTAYVSITATTGAITDNGDTDKDVRAARLMMSAATAVGAATNHLDVDVTLLAGRVVGNVVGSGFFVADDNALTVDTVADITVNRVDSAGTTTGIAQQTDAAVSGVRVTGTGDLILVTLNGLLTINQTVAVDTAGNVRLSAQTTGSNDKDLTINAAVTTASGNLSAVANRNITQTLTGDLFAGGTGTIDVEAVNGSITVNANGSDSGSATTAGGSIRYKAATNVALTGLDATLSGFVSVIATSGSVTDNGDFVVDIKADKLRITAGVGIGTESNHLDTLVAVLAARATSGGVFVSDQTALTVDTVEAMSVTRVNTNATTTPINETVLEDVVTTAGDGHVVLIALDGTLTVNDGVSLDGFGVTAHGFGNVRLESKTTGSNDKDISLNAVVRSTGGRITVLANNSISQAAKGDISTAGTIDVQAQNGSITMTDGAIAQTTGAALRYLAAVNVVLGGLKAATGDVSVTASAGSITDGGDTDKEIIAGRARLVAGNAIGGGSTHLDLTIGTLAARAGAGGIFITEDNTLIVDAIGAITVSRVDTTGLVPINLNQTDAALTEVRTLSGNGSVVLITLDGTLTVNQSVVADGDGNIRLEARTSAANDKDVLINASVQTGTGDISVLANRIIDQSVVGDVSTVGGTIDFLAINGVITMSNGALTQSGGGNILYVAATSVTLGGLNATGGNVGVKATGGSIIDGGDEDKEITASAVRLEALTGIGASGNALDIAVAVVTARAGSGGIYLQEDNAITVDTVAVITVNRVDTDATTPIGLRQSTTVLSDLVTVSGNGNVVLQTVNGEITVNDGSTPADSAGIRADGSGNVLLEAKAVGTNDKDVTLNTGIFSVTGSITVVANRSLTQAAAATLSTGGTGTIDVEAGKGSITMINGARAVTAGGNIRYKAEVDVALSGLDAVTGSVSLIATTGFISDAGDTRRDVIATALRILAGNGAGTGNSLDTEVATLSAQAKGGGVHINELNDLIIGDVGVTVNRILSSGSPSSLEDILQSDVSTTSNNGSIVIVVAGNLIINDGTAGTAGVGVSADGSGSVALISNGSSTKITANTDVKSGSGSISVLASGDVAFTAGADIRTSGTGLIVVTAGTGSITQADASLFITGTGDITLTADDDVTLGGVNTGGNVSITATTGAIFDGGDTYVDVVANQLTLVAADGVASIETTVATLIAHVTDAGALIINETDAVVLSDVDTANGSITVTAGGQVTATDVVSLTDSDTNDITITTTAGGIVAGIINAGALGDINLTAFTTITDATGKITGDVLTVNAGGAATLDTTVATLVAHLTAAGNLVVTETDALILSDIDVANGSVLITVGGDLAVNDGTDNDGIGLSVTGSNHILLQSTGGSLTINADIRSGSGYITLLAGNALTMATGADVVTNGGVVDMEAGSGNFMMGDGATVVTGGGNIRVVAGNNAIIGLLDSRTGGAQSGWGKVYVSAVTGGISDAGNAGSTSVRVYGQGVILSAARSIGGISEPTYRLQYTTDFVTWTDLVTVSTGDTSVTYVDPTPADSRRFYRVAYETGGLIVSLRAPQVLVDRSVRLTWDITYTGAYVPVTKALVVETAVLAAESGTGSVVVNDANAVTVGDVTVAYQKVLSNGTLGTLTDDGVKSDVRTMTGNGSVLLRTLAGDLTITEGSTGAGAGVNAAGSGKVYLSASGSVLVQANILSGSGHLTMAAGSNVTMSAGTMLATTGGEVSVSAGTGSATVTNLLTGGGDVRVSAQGALTVSTISAGMGSVSLVAVAGSITDGTDAGANVTAAAVRLQAGGSIGALNDEFVLVTGVVAVQAGGVVRLGNTGDLVVASMAVTVNTVGANGGVTGVAETVLAGLTAGGSMVLVNTGNLTVDMASGVTGTGQVLLSATGSITVNSAVTLANGSLSLLAGSGVQLNALASVAGGTIEVVAQGGSISNAKLQTTGGNVRLTATGGVSLGVVDARSGGAQSTWGDVSVIAGGDITDADGDALVNIHGRNVRLSAAGSAGTLVPATADGIEVNALTAAVSAGGSVNVVAATGLILDTVNAVAVNRVGIEGLLSLNSDAGSLSGASASTGIVIRTLAGNLTVQTAVGNTGTGNMRLSAVGGDVTVNANVTVADGSLSLLASGSVTVAVGVVLNVTGGTADIAAAGGSVTLAGTVQTAGANIRIYAAVNVALALVDARTVGDRGGNALTNQITWGEVSVTAAGGSITDGSNDAAVDVYARNLRMTAGISIGVTGVNVVGIETMILALLAGTGGINVLEATNVIVGTVGGVAAGQVQEDGSVVVVADAANLTGAVKTGGSLNLDTANGSNIPGYPQFTILTVLNSGSTPNPITGLYEQRVQITNTSNSTIDAVRVAIGNLPVGVALAYPAGTLVDGRPYLMFNQTLAAGQSAVIVIEYRVPNVSLMPTAPVFEVDVVSVQAQPSLAGSTPVTVGVVIQRLENNRYQVTLPTLFGRIYYMQYSDDGINWITVLAPIIGTGNAVNWLDHGPSKTYPDPAIVINRFYRIFVMP